MPSAQKTCRSCHVDKSMDSFARFSRSKDGLAIYCRACVKKRYHAVKLRCAAVWLKNNPDKRKAYVQSAAGWCRLHMRAMKYASKKRGHPPPEITHADLLEITKSDDWKVMFQAWLSSGCSKSLAVGLDRRDNKKHYTLDNVTLCTWRENNQRWIEARRWENGGWVT